MAWTNINLNSDETQFTQSNADSIIAALIVSRDKISVIPRNEEAKVLLSRRLDSIRFLSGSYDTDTHTLSAVGNSDDFSFFINALREIQSDLSEIEEAICAIHHPSVTADHNPSESSIAAASHATLHIPETSTLPPFASGWGWGAQWGLTTLIIPEGVSSIPSAAFRGSPNFFLSLEPQDYRPGFNPRFFNPPLSTASITEADFIDQSFQAAHTHTSSEPISSGKNAKILEELNVDEIPEEFNCSLSFNIMDDPVYDENVPNIKFDKAWILRALEKKAENPFTRTPLSPDNLKEDVELKEKIAEFIQDLQAKNEQQGPSM